MTKIVKIANLPRKGKRLRVHLENSDYFDFGLEGGQKYIDHRDKKKRDNYRRRHYANDIDIYLIETLTPSPALYSYFILWGDSHDVMENVDSLNKLRIIRQNIKYLDFSSSLFISFGLIGFTLHQIQEHFLVFGLLIDSIILILYNNYFWRIKKSARKREFSRLSPDTHPLYYIRPICDQDLDVVIGNRSHFHLCDRKLITFPLM